MDADLRELERRYRTSGSPAEGAAWLSARLRAGDLARAELEVAALCGDAAARRAWTAREPLSARALEDAVHREKVLRLSVAPETVARWVASGLPAVSPSGAGGPPRYDPVEVLDWLEREQAPELASVTIGLLHDRHPIAAARMAWAAHREVRKTAVRAKARWAAFLGACEAWFDDPRREAGALATLRGGLGRTAGLLEGALQTTPGLPATFAAYLAAATRARRTVGAAALFLAARAEVARWAQRPSTSEGDGAYVLVPRTEAYTTGDWYDREHVVERTHELVDRRTGRVVRTIAEDAGVRGVELSPDGTELVVHHEDGRAERSPLPPPS